MLKLSLVPAQSSYQVVEGDDVVTTKLSGGADRYRRDVLNAPVTVEVQLEMEATQYQYFRAFYNVIGKGADAFLMDLLIDEPVLSEHVVHIKPGTLKLMSVKGTMFTVKFTLEAQPNEGTVDFAGVVQNWQPEIYVSPPPPVDWGIDP